VSLDPRSGKREFLKPSPAGADGSGFPPQKSSESADYFFDIDIDGRRWHFIVYDGFY